MNQPARTPPLLRVPVLTEVVDLVPPSELPLPLPLPLQDDGEQPWTRTTRLMPVQKLPPAVLSDSELPALTDVVEPAALRDAVSATPPIPAAAWPDEAQLTARILGDLQRQVELMLEHRVRAALAPAFARLAEAVVQEAQGELASALQDMVARAVAQEMARQRAR